MATTTSTTAATPVALTFREGLKMVCESGLMANREAMILAIKVISGFIAAYIIAALVRSAGFPAIDFVAAGVVGVFAGVFWLAPLVVLGAIVGGGLTAVSKNTTLEEGVKKGLDLLGRAGITVTVFTAEVFLFFGSWPGDFGAIHYMITFTGPIMLLLFQIFDRVPYTGRWHWWIGGSYVGAMMLYYYATSLPFVQTMVTTSGTSGLTTLAGAVAVAGLAAGLYYLRKDKGKLAKAFFVIASIAGLLWLMGADTVVTGTREAVQNAADGKGLPSLLGSKADAPPATSYNGELGSWNVTLAGGTTSEDVPFTARLKVCAATPPNIKTEIMTSAGWVTWTKEATGSAYRYKNTGANTTTFMVARHETGTPCPI